eukprot:CAMPEP_0198288842 /NCGR_PEP_ID=MMETSP1449-20131203/7217_1 /TAXON_ID=420275 /ORGANISM="Attheya septentrionalis, Strain CCMP2084" /LENGTH=438 /DNA_ID=CAMNT_0043987059 /DNA_START=299 /DNA_END=1615 /DNA_ORIENTATION=-
MARMVRPSERMSLFSSMILLGGTQKEHEAGKVHTLELFSDLAVVVTIHTLSEELEEHIMLRSERTFAIFWFLLQVFLVLVLWQGCVLTTNIGNMYTANTLDLMHYVVVFGFMGLLVFVVKASESVEGNSAMSTAFFFIVGRSLLGLAFVAEASSVRPDWIDIEHYEHIQRLRRLMPWMGFLELLPLTISLVFAWFADDDSISSTAILFGGYGTFVIFLGLRMYHSKASFDDTPDYDHSDVQVLDVEHLQERYALITLIFLGELCFAAASESGAYYQSLLALLAAIGGFLIYFIARVEGRTEAAMRSAQGSIYSQHLHFLLFGTIPIMGVAYVKLMEQLVEKEEEDTSQFHDSGVILGISSGVFLLITGLLELLTKDPELQKDQPRIHHTIRVILQIGMGIFVAASASLSNFSGTVVSFSMFLTASVLVWGCQTDEMVL